MADSRTIRVEALTRVEGEGGLHLRLRGRDVEEVRLEIYEPPRLFESLLRGRALEDVPDITARICGICPVAYQMSSVHALEAALGISIPPTLRRLRRLLYCGEWIESHTLHMFMLNLPDLLGYESALEMATDHPEVFNEGLELKKYGNALLELLGGRAVHPVNVAVGGFYRLPGRKAMLSLIPTLERGLELAQKLTRWIAALDFPQFERAYEMVSLVHPDEYPMNEGRISSTKGWSIAVEEFEQKFTEQQVPHSTALHCRMADAGTCYLVGPLARVNQNLERLAPAARRLAAELPIDWPCSNPFQGILARGVEVAHAYEEALGIVRNYRPAQPCRVEYSYAAGEGCAATEAPRGLLYHHYRVNEDGLVGAAKIIPPTSQNQAQMEDDLRQFVPCVEGDDDQLALACERLVRSYDPCISCATHFLKVHVERV